MKTIYLNTATDTCRVALFEGEDVVQDVSWPAERNESETLQPAVDELLTKHQLSPSDIDRLVVCVGPGGFTSARVGVSAANAWAFAQQIPLAACTVFDLYADDELVVVQANPNQAWVRKPGSEPEWIEVDLDRLDLSQASSHEGLPDLSQLSFQDKPVQPWYYKDPNITWSDKIRPQQ